MEENTRTMMGLKCSPAELHGVRRRWKRQRKTLYDSRESSSKPHQFTDKKVKSQKYRITESADLEQLTLSSPRTHQELWFKQQDMDLLFYNVTVSCCIKGSFFIEPFFAERTTVWRSPFLLKNTWQKRKLHTNLQNQSFHSVLQDTEVEPFGKHSLTFLY